MPIHYPTSRKEIVERIQADIRAEFGTIDFLSENFFQTLVVAMSGRHYEIYEQIKAAQKTAFPNTAIGEFLDLWMSLKGVNRQSATQANGEINVTGTLDTVIPKDSVLTSGSGKEYQTTADGKISEIVLAIDTLTRSGSIATATFLSPHGIATGIEGVVAGSDQAEYNGTFTFIAVSDIALNYEITGTPATPATGAITFTVELASIPILSTDFGSDVNLTSGSQLTFQTPVSGADDVALVEFGGIQGGNNQESDESYRTRGLLAYSDPIANFNNSGIAQIILLVPEVTRAWVFDITPARGKVTCYFTLDQRENIYPTLDDVARVKAELETIRPANTSYSDIIVESPTKQLVDFTFTSINPSTTTMQDAVKENLKAFFFEKSNVGENIQRLAYQATIFETIDPTTGQKVQSFILSEPIDDISVPTASLASLGDINWNL